VNQSLQLISQGKWVDETAPGDRSPSPEPTYNEVGARVNTREWRAKEKLTKQRNVSVGLWACRPSKDLWCEDTDPGVWDFEPPN